MAALPDNDRLTGPFIADAGQRDFPADFPLIKAAGLRAYRLRLGVGDVLAPPELEPVDDHDGGFTARLATPALAGDRIWLFSALPAERAREHVPNGSVRSSTLEGDAEEFQAQLQEHRRDLARTVRGPLGEVLTGDLPRAADRAMRLLAFGPDGEVKVTERGEAEIIGAIDEVIQAAANGITAVNNSRDAALAAMGVARAEAVGLIEAARDDAITQVLAVFSYDMTARRMLLTHFTLGLFDQACADRGDDVGNHDPLEVRPGWSATNSAEIGDRTGSVARAVADSGWTASEEGEISDGVGSVAPAGALLAVGWSRNDGIEISDGVGSVVRVGASDEVAETGVAGWSTSELAWVNARAATKAQGLNAVDVSALATVGTGANLLLFTGQSFDAGSDNARLFATTSRIALMGVVHNGWSVGPDARCVNAGPVYVTYGGDTRQLSSIRENFVGGTNVDQIISDANVAVGNYPLNARGGAPQPLATILRDWLRQQWLALTTRDASRYHVAMSHSKTDGSIAEVGTGDGLARMQSALDVFAEAVTSLNGAAPATVAAGEVDPTRLEAVLMNHGEADESGATATYAADVQAFDSAIHAKAVAKWGQAARAPMLMLQVGGPRYATAAMVCARQQAQMARDFTGQNVNKFVVGSKTEVPSFANLTVETGHPNYGDGHPTLAGNVIMAIRYAVGLHYLSDRRQNYWLPFPHEVYYRGSRFLIAVPCMFPPLREAAMPRGCVMEMLANKGLTFESEAGVENPVLRAEVVPGHPFLIEGECLSDISASTIMKAGKGQAGRQGVVNFRDSFDLRLPFDLPFNGSQTQYGNPLFGAGGDTGQGWRDSPVANGLGRFCEDIPGYVGKPDLGNPMLRDQVVAQPIPFIT